MDIKVMGQRIRYARRQKGMTMEDLATQLGYSPESVGHLECGARGPSLKILIRISEILDVSMDYLVGHTETPTQATVKQIAESAELSAGQQKELQEMTERLLPFIKRYVK